MEEPLYREDASVIERGKAPRGTWNGHVLSGWWRRVWATFIDTLVLVAITAALLGVTGAGFDWLSEETSLIPSADALLVMIFGALASLAYLPPMMSLTDGRTLGKLALRIRVVRTDRQPMSFLRAAWREVGVKNILFTWPPLLWAVLGPLDSLWPLWDRENRAIHDMLAGTRVVRVDVAPPTDGDGDGRYGDR